MTTINVLRTRFIITIALGGLVILSGCFTVKSTPDFSYQKVNAAAFDSLLQTTTPHYLVDVRTKGEYRKSHMEGAVHFSYLSFRFRKNVRTLQRSVPVFVYCQTCHRSPLAARKLKRLGFDKVTDLEGGYAKWKPTRIAE